MNFKELFNLQYILDQRIENERGLTGKDLFKDKMLALLVEVGELANETRCFKFWSDKPASPRDVILEEFVDGVHFILSLGIVLGYNQDFEIPAPTNEKRNGSPTEKFLEVFDAASQLLKTRNREDYMKLFSVFLELGMILGFTSEDIFQAYTKKNEINHQRQDEGY